MNKLFTGILIALMIFGALYGVSQVLGCKGHMETVDSRFNDHSVCVED